MDNSPSPEQVTMNNDGEYNGAALLQGTKQDPTAKQGKAH